MKSTIKCPECGFEKEETMPQDYCQILFECTNCGAKKTPGESSCCVFCSYGTVKCPPQQQE